MRYKFTLIALIILGFCSGFIICSSYSPPIYSLAVTLMPHYPDGPVTFGIAKSKDGILLEHNGITQRNWILIGAGDFKSKCNPGLENLFQKHHIENCTTHYYPEFRDTKTFCPLTERIWKVRYDTLPGKSSKSGVKDFDNEFLGWANDKQHPTKAQMDLLNKYGITSVSDAIYGDSLWSFLQDINDANWIKTYASH